MGSNTACHSLNGTNWTSNPTSKALIAGTASATRAGHDRAVRYGISGLAECRTAQRAGLVSNRALFGAPESGMGPQWKAALPCSRPGMLYCAVSARTHVCLPSLLYFVSYRRIGVWRIPLVFVGAATQKYHLPAWDVTEYPMRGTLCCRLSIHRASNNPLKPLASQALNPAAQVAPASGICA